jgi:hypothetical protein
MHRVLPIHCSAICHIVLLCSPSPQDTNLIAKIFQKVVHKDVVIANAQKAIVRRVGDAVAVKAKEQIS